MVESTLEKIAERILALDEASLASLWSTYKKRMEDFDFSREWERSVIVFFIINAVRAKNQIFNEKLLKAQQGGERAKHPAAKPDLKLVKS